MTWITSLSATLYALTGFKSCDNSKPFANIRILVVSMGKASGLASPSPGDHVFVASKSNSFTFFTSSCSWVASSISISSIALQLVEIESNRIEFKDLKLVEVEKIFKKDGSHIIESYSLAGVITSNKEVAYYDMQDIIADFFHTV